MDIINDIYTSSKLSTLDIVLLILYALVCILIGLLSSRRQKDDDYMIAGRQLNTWGFITSVVASYVGGAAIVAYTAYVYQFGVSALAVFVGTSIGFIIFIPYALKIRKAGEEQEFFTLSDWFYSKFNKSVGLLSAIILFVVYFGMLLNQFIAGSSILASISGWSYETALFFSSLVISIYLFAGGFKSVIKTDIFQYIVLFVLFIFLGFILMNEKSETTIELIDFGRMNTGMTIAFIAFGIFIIFQSSEYWQRVYAAKSPAVMKRGFVGSAILSVITGIAITLIGLAAHYNLPELEPRHAFAEGLSILLPVEYISAGLILIFAAIMSSADTQIFVLASSVSVDFFGKFSRKKLSKHQIMLRTRIFIVIFSLLGFLLAWNFRDLVAVIVFITGLGFTIIPAAIASFHFKISGRAASISFIGGIIYVMGLMLVASLQADSVEFFKNNADLAVGSILISTILLIIVQNVPKIFRSK